MANEPKPPKPDYPAHLLTELLELRPDIEGILADEPRSNRRFSATLEDKVQAVLLKVLQHLPGYRPHEDGLKPWVTRITRNFKHDEHRAKERHDATFDEGLVDGHVTPAPGVSPERAARVNALASKVFAAMAEMPPALQEVLILSAFGEQSHAEIATKLGISEDAVKMRLSRARQFLRKKVGRVDDHLGVMPVIWSHIRRAMTFFGRVVHLWPPIIVGFVALPQIESTISIVEPDNIVVMAHPAPALPEPMQVSAPNVVEMPAPDIQHRPKSKKSLIKPRQRVQRPVVDIPTDSADFLVGDGL